MIKRDFPEALAISFGCAICTGLIAQSFIPTHPLLTIGLVVGVLMGMMSKLCARKEMENG